MQKTNFSFNQTFSYKEKFGHFFATFFVQAKKVNKQFLYTLSFTKKVNKK